MLAVTQYGAPDGQPVLLLHGGPGSGMSPLLPRFFDPARHRLIGLDQRGAGASRPAGGTRHNGTDDLLADLRRLQHHLGIERWCVAGGSWGATLALAHAADAPQAVSGLLLRAPFLARPGDVAAFFDRASATDATAVAAWEALAALMAGTASADWPAELATALADATDTPRLHRVAAAWWSWEQALAAPGRAPASLPAGGGALDALVQRYRVQAHYLAHGCWLQAPPLLQRLAGLHTLPVLVLHGDADRICPPDGARALQAALPQAVLRWVGGAGHDPTHPGMVAAMRAATDAWARDGHFETLRDRPCLCA